MGGGAGWVCARPSPPLVTPCTPTPPIDILHATFSFIDPVYPVLGVQLGSYVDGFGSMHNGTWVAVETDTTLGWLQGWRVWITL